MTGAVRSVYVTPCHKYVVAGSTDLSARVWSAKTGHVVSCIGGIHSGSVNAVCSVPGIGGTRGRPLIVTAGADHKVITWDISTATAERVAKMVRRVTCCCLALPVRVNKA